ncbi:hypothetical protein [Pseudomonas putida]
MEHSLRAEVLRRLQDQYGLKPMAGTLYLRKGTCPNCGKKELYSRQDEPWFIKCGRESKCGEQWHIKELFDDLFDDYSKRYPATQESPRASANAYLQNARGFDLDLVKGWYTQAGAVSASAMHDNGRWSIADPRLPEASDRLTCVIESLDGTWHRPFTTLELAALQSLVEPEEQLELDGLSDQAWRERIGNAVPPAAAEAIAHVMGTTLLLAAQGETFMLSSMPIWVRPVAVGLSVAHREIAG